MKKYVKKALLISIAILAVILLLAQFGFFSGSPGDLGIINSRLKAPSKNENSVSSQANYFVKTESNVDYAKIQPFNYKGNGKNALPN